MKVETVKAEPVFEPVQITLETQAELNLLFHTLMCSRDVNMAVFDSLRRHLSPRTPNALEVLGEALRERVMGN